MRRREFLAAGAAMVTLPLSRIGAAAAERIAVFLGIQERNWTPGRKEWSEDRKNYTWTHEADFGFKGRWVHAIGKAGSRDKFFSFAHGAWKPLDEIQEDHVKTAAFRSTRKDGIRTLLGLRGIPLTKLKELGFDLNKSAYAGFEEKGKTLANDQKQTNKESGLIERSITVKELKRAEGTNKTTGKPWIRWDVTDTEGVKYAMFVGKGESKRAALLEDSYGDALPTKIEFQANKSTDGRESYLIQKVNGVTDA